MSDKMTPAKVKAMLKVLRDADVSEFELDGLKVKFYREVKFPAGAQPIDANQLMDEMSVDPALKDSMNTHLDVKSPRRAEEEHQLNMMWST